MRKPLDDVSSSPRSLSPPPRPSPLKEGVRSVRRICPPAQSGCTFSNERGPPAQFIRRHSLSAGRIVLCPRCQGPSLLKCVRSVSRLVSCPLRRDRHTSMEGDLPEGRSLPLYPIGIRVPYNAADPVSTIMCRRCFPSPPCSLVASAPSFALAGTACPPGLLSFFSLGNYHQKRSWCS